MVENKKVILEACFDFVGLSDYYSGHGHVFEEDLVACFRFGISTDYTETIGEVIERALEDINAYEPDILDEEYREVVDNITAKDLEEALWAQIPGGYTKDEKFFPDEEPIKDKEEYEELPMIIGYIHVYKAP
jgi:hypothetical protein